MRPLYIVGWIVALALGAIMFVNYLRQPPPPPSHSLVTAYSVCRQFVTDRLRAPATADFPSRTSDDVRIQHGPTGAYEVAAYVDSQNGFGALLRTRFTCKVEWVGDDQYKLVAINLE